MFVGAKWKDFMFCLETEAQASENACASVQKCLRFHFQLLALPFSTPCASIFNSLRKHFSDGFMGDKTPCLWCFLSGCF